MKILLIDDDLKLGRLLKTYLGEHEHEVFHTPSPSAGLAKLHSGQFELVILDVMMPEEDGFSVCKKIRERSNIPVIMLTARVDVIDRVVGLELGADDYMTKPFEPRELLARIAAVTRRQQPKNEAILKSATLELDLHTRQVSQEGKTLDITTAEFEVLWQLMQQPGRVFSREQIIEQLHGTGWSTFDRSVDVLISRLRAKLDTHPNGHSLIATVRGVGYKFAGSK